VTMPPGRDAGGTTQTSPDDGQPESTEASPMTQAVAGEVCGGLDEATPPPGTQLPEAVGP
jgi:hypothetical protein